MVFLCVAGASYMPYFTNDAVDDNGSCYLGAVYAFRNNLSKPPISPTANISAPTPSWRFNEVRLGLTVAGDFVENCRIFRSAEFAQADHRLLVATQKIRLNPMRWRHPSS